MLKDTLAHWPSIGGVAPLLFAFHDAVPNAGLQWTPEGMREMQQGAAAHVDNPQLTNHFVGVEAVCEELVAAGTAREWNRAGSMLVLEKLTELPSDFSDRAAQRLSEWTAAASQRG